MSTLVRSLRSTLHQGCSEARAHRYPHKTAKAAVLGGDAFLARNILAELRSNFILILEHLD